MTKATAVKALAAALLLFPAYVSGQQPASLDPGSAECLGCHQDPSAVNEPFRYCHKGDCDHPVGVNYVTLASRNRGLVPPEGLIKGITLVDGRIGCITCHTPYTPGHEEQAVFRGTSQPDPMLSVDNTGSGLCVACHRK